MQSKYIMIKKIIISGVLSLTTIFSFSIVDRSCTRNLYGIFSNWLKESTGFHEYLFFLYGFLINFFILFFFYFIILLNFKINLSKKWVLTFIIIFSSLYVYFTFKTNIRIQVDPRNIVPKEYLEDTVDKKMTLFLTNTDMECPD